jgi:hypothetical protein
MALGKSAWPLHELTARLDWIGILLITGYVFGFEFAALHHHPAGLLISPNRNEPHFDQVLMGQVGLHQSFLTAFLL